MTQILAYALRTTCRTFLAAELAARPALRAILALGRIAHESVLRALGQKLSAFPFGHGSVHAIGPLRLYDSYHCSRYNTNTGVLTAAMFEAVFARISADLRMAPDPADPALAAAPAELSDGAAP